MLRKNSKMLFCFFMIAVIAILVIIIVKKQKEETNLGKTSNIPANAIWKGGLDEGFWFDITEFNPKNNQYRIRIYNDYDGQLNIDANFEQREIKCKFLSKDTLLSRIIYWDWYSNKDNKRIIMLDGCDLYVSCTYYDAFD